MRSHPPAQDNHSQRGCWQWLLLSGQLWKLLTHPISFHPQCPVLISLGHLCQWQSRANCPESELSRRQPCGHAFTGTLRYSESHCHLRLPSKLATSCICIRRQPEVQPLCFPTESAICLCLVLSHSTGWLLRQASPQKALPVGPKGTLCVSQQFWTLSKADSHLRLI